MNHPPMNRLQTAYRRGFGLIALAAVLSVAAGCTAMKPLAVDNPSELSQQLEVGQKVVVETIDGERFKFIINKIDESGISGEEHFIAYSDIDELRTRELSATNTVGLMLALNVALGAAAVAVGVPAIY